MNIDSGIKDRITTAANALYEEAARSAFPTVAEVRARAGSDMNAASLVMREWRRAQTVQAAPVVVEVPGKVQAAHHAALAVLWAEAQALANERLLSAQTAWDAERVEAETLRGELSAAFEDQRRELEAAEAARDAATDEVEELKTALASSQATQQTQAVELAQVRERLMLTEQAARDAAAHHVAELEAARDAARHEIQELKTALASSQATQQTQAVEVAQVRERLTLTEQAARDAAAHHVAELDRLTATNGKIETMQAQIAALMRSLTPATPTPAQSTAPKPARSKPSK